MADDQQAEINEPRARLDELTLPEEVDRRPPRACPASESCCRPAAEYGVIRTYLDWILTPPLGKTTEDNLALDHARADPRRGPLRPREGQGTNHRVPAVPAKNDSRGRSCASSAARGRQDLAGPFDCQRAGRKFVRISRRRPRRGRDPRPPVHVHRRYARRSISAIRDAETMNLVFLIDEIDVMAPTTAAIRRARCRKSSTRSTPSL